MLIDLILDRKDGVEYNLDNFKEDVKYYSEFFGGYCTLVYDAMMIGTEKDVKDALCKYIDGWYGGNASIKRYIRRVNWL